MGRHEGRERPLPERSINYHTLRSPGRMRALVRYRLGIAALNARCRRGSTKHDFEVPSSI
eukprot:scaffold12410_cov119-Isochrysis_galbana.AAC.3